MPGPEVPRCSEVIMTRKRRRRRRRRRAWSLDHNSIELGRKEPMIMKKNKRP